MFQINILLCLGSMHVLHDHRFLKIKLIMDNILSGYIQGSRPSRGSWKPWKLQIVKIVGKVREIDFALQKKTGCFLYYLFFKAYKFNHLFSFWSLKK